MKHLVTCLAIVLMLSQAANGQDWAPYVPGQVSYYNGYNNDTNKILKRELKALFHRNGYSVAYFHDGFNQNCPADKVTSGPWYTFKPDSLIYRPVGFSYHYRGDSTFWPFIDSIGRTWRIASHLTYYGAFDSIEIRFDSTGVGTFLGITDSIRYYSTIAIKNGLPHQHPINENGIWLSKHFGFIREIGLFPSTTSNNLNNYYLFPGKIIGITNDTLSVGFVLPDIMDFFNYEPGNIVKWKRELVYNTFPPMPTDIWIYRDSIISVTKSDSIVSYTYIRSEQKGQSSVQVKSGLTSFPRIEYEFLVKGNSMYYANGHIPSLSETTVLSNMPIATNQNEICLSARWIGEWVSDDCNWVESPDLGMTVGVCLNFGLTSKSWHNHSDEYFYLIGRTTSIDTFGDIRPLGIAIANPNTVVLLYPNPATASFYLSLPDNLTDPALVTITDIQGRVVHREEYRHGQQISIVPLAAGTYVVSVETQHWVSHLKLVKQ